MEEANCDPSEITSVDVSNVLRASIVFINKKRKLQADLLGLPLPKHNRCDQGFTSELGSPSMETSQTKGFCAVLVTGRVDGEARDSESDLESGNGSDSLAEDADSFLSVSNGAKDDSHYLKMRSVDCQSTPVSMGGNDYKGSMFSLNSRVSRSKPDKGKSPDMQMDCDNPQNDIKMLASSDHENVFEYDDEDYSSLDYIDESIEQYKKVQEMLYSSSKNSESVLSSGNFNNQENQPATEKPTIDIEFEQYFSMLMM